MKEFYQNTYAKSISCTVKEVINDKNCIKVLTDKTIFYPECGGQPGDTGFLGNYEIIDTKKAENGDSIHILPPNSAISVGQNLDMTLDWEHRYKFMTMHTTQHLLSGLLFNLFQIGTVSVHLGDDYLTIETNQEEIDSDTISQLVETANDKIAENHKIIYHEMSHSDAEALNMRRSIKVEGDVRIVEIEDIDKIACGGIHVASTSELRLVVYLGQQKIRDHARLFFTCGKEAQELAKNNTRLLDSLKNKLNCSSYEEIEPKVEKLTQQYEELKTKYKILCEKTAYSEIQNMMNNDIACFDTAIDFDSILKACERFESLALCVENSEHWLIVLKGRFSNIEFNTIKDKIMTPSGAKGGGRNGVYQGLCTKSLKNLFLQLVQQVKIT